jgi:hypothetical protein
LLVHWRDQRFEIIDQLGDGHGRGGPDFIDLDATVPWINMSRIPAIFCQGISGCRDLNACDTCLVASPMIKSW